MKKLFNVKVSRTYVTRLMIEADSKDEAQKKYDALVDDGTIYQLELEQMEIRDDEVVITDSTKRYRFARVCSVTGCGMNEGWVFEDGIQYAKEEKDAYKLARDYGYQSIQEAFDEGWCYWTAWEDESEYEYESEHEDGRDAVEMEGGEV
jgi:hypothetical protein